MRRQILALVAAACIATTGCSTANPAETPAPTDQPTTSSEATIPAPSESPAGTDSTSEDVDLATHTFTISPQQAIVTGLAEAGDGIMHSIELDWSRRSNAWVYELDILVGTTDHDVDVHADTGEILDHEQDDTDAKEQPIDLASPMSWETARDKALGSVQGSIISWKLEWDNKAQSYGFDIQDSSRDETEVQVSVDTGEVRIDD